MHAASPPTRPSWRHVMLWVTLGLLLAAAFHGYWLVVCILLVGVIAIFVTLQSQRS